MSDSIWSNPSGYTDLPWPYSLNWIKEQVLIEVELIDLAMNSATKCPTCGWDVLASGKCPNCLDSFVDLSSRASVLPDDYFTYLDCSPDKLRQLAEVELLELHNLVVELVRSACVRDLRASKNQVKVREGLLVSREWEFHFSNLHKEQPQILLWMALKHAMVGNPLAGELFEWNNLEWSPNIENARGNGKLVGAAAIGLLAGLLFG